MTVYYNYNNGYSTPSGYENALLPQKDEEIMNLKKQLAVAHGLIVEKEDRVTALEVKNKHLLNGYNRRQLNYSTALTVLQKKNKEDMDAIKKLREENSQLKMEIETKKKATKSDEKELLKKKMAALAKEIGSRKRALIETKKNGNSKYTYVRQAVKPAEIEIIKSDTKSNQEINCKVIKGTPTQFNSDIDESEVVKELLKKKIAALAKEIDSRKRALIETKKNVSDIKSDIKQQQMTAKTNFVKGVHYVGDVEAAFRHNKEIQSNNKGVHVTARHKRPSYSYFQQGFELTYNMKFGRRGYC